MNKVNPYDVAIGKIFAEKRKELGITQAELGKQFGLSNQIICNYENGYRSMNASLFFDICDFYKLDVNKVAKDVIKEATLIDKNK